MSSSGNVWYCKVPKQYLTVFFLDQNVELVQCIYFLVVLELRIFLHFHKHM